MHALHNIPANYLLHDNKTLREVHTELTIEGPDGCEITQELIEHDVVCPAKATVLEAVFAPDPGDSYIVCEFNYGAATNTLKIPTRLLVSGGSELAAHLLGAGFVWAADKGLAERFRGYLVDSLVHIQRTWAHDLTSPG